jgi:RNA polymerase sigma-70 factor (ECF subfamily)
VTPRLRATPRPDEDDAALLARIAAGDLEALAEIYRRHQAPVRHFLARATGHANDVDDLIQTIFLEAARSASRYDGRASCRPWLLGIAVHHLQRRKSAFLRFVRRFTSSGREDRADRIDPRSNPETRPDIERALASISEAKRITFLLAELEELSGAEIAALMNVPIGTVWTRLHAARRELRAFLEGP